MPLRRVLGLSVRQKCICGRAPPQTPLRELTALPMVHIATGVQGARSRSRFSAVHASIVPPPRIIPGYAYMHLHGERTELLYFNVSACM